MPRWSFEPGHTAAEFRVRHMMVTWVRGHFKDVHGRLDFDPADPLAGRVEVVIEAGRLWSGERDRDQHLLGADFLDAAAHPSIRYSGRTTRATGPSEFRVEGELELRGVTRSVALEVRYLGSWQTPWWEGNVDRGPRTRAGFVATARIDRFDFGVSWQSPLERGGVVVGREVEITLDAEAILEDGGEQSS